MTKASNQRAQLTRALARLDEVLAMEKTDIVRDSAMVRFIFTFDLAWKLIQSLVRDAGGTCTSPRSCFTEAFLCGVMPNDPFWFQMLDRRNEAVHAYNEEIAERVYALLPAASKRFHALLDELPKT